MQKRAFCYLPANAPGEGFHYIDHIVPLAIELDLPIVVRFEDQRELILKFYPKAKLEFVPANDPLTHLQNPVVIVSNAFRHQLEADLLYERMLFGSFESVYCPHGLSDKEMLFGKFQELDEDHKVLVYGEKMQKEVPSHCTPFLLGNYRKHHFKRFDSHYKSILKQTFPKLSFDKWTLLWAPSWVFKFIPSIDLPLLSSLLEKTLLSKIPENIQILFKPHPYLLDQIPSTLVKIEEAAKEKENLIYLKKMPYIYPLFDFASAYLGDTSSVGYDFLSTGKPIFSLSKNLASPWQNEAFDAPIIDGKIVWEKLLEKAKSWDPANSFALLQSGFAEKPPLAKSKDALLTFLLS